MRRTASVIFVNLIFGVLNAQVSRLTEGLGYKLELSGQLGQGDHTPFWQTANRYGLAEISNNTGYFRVGLNRSVNADAQRKWRIGYGADFVTPIGYSSKFLVQQLYADFHYRKIGLSIGQKERPFELKNNSLSSGGMTLGANSRPIPQVRFDFFPDYLSFEKADWIGLKGHLAYGVQTDRKWQQDFNGGNKNAVYTANPLFHSKAGYLRIGNPERFPLVLTGGCEMVCQFGGTVWNRDIPGSNADGSYKFKHGIKEFLQAFIPTGSDIVDGENPNIMGNQLGSYMARLDYVGKGWSASLYGEHYFDDHSQMGFDFAWKDITLGTELNLPKNRFVSTLLYEYMRTTDQSGPILLFLGNKVHNIGGQDNYYNHNIYGAYQHAGFVMGNPCLLSPLYNKDGRICTYDNRILVNHLGISGQPHNDVSYRVLLTLEKSLGTYFLPHESPRHGTFLLIESTYRPHHIKGLGITASLGQNTGSLLGKSTGGMLTVTYNGIIRK